MTEWKATDPDYPVELKTLGELTQAKTEAVEKACIEYFESKLADQTAQSDA